ncbi:MAG TPA: carboxymuconolactone decarboxylase family protein [Candidatus Acidoferrum sp.]|jgi:4-carboxymuconolactone decarboxylase|nr:carboxymuconolactone decarboxylase family protein [Candidatus Acidoferrum sp.]
MMLPRLWFASFLLLLLVGLGAPVFAQDRMPPIPPEKLTEEQKKAVEAYLAAQANIQKMFGDKYPRPVQMQVGMGWSELLRSPELLLSVNAMREYVEYKPDLAPRIREMVIMITGRQTSTDFMWDSHYPVAIKTGITPEILKSIAEGRRPAGMPEDEEIVYDFCDELHRNQSVSDATYARALAKFGERGVVDIVGVYGWYSMWAMMNKVWLKAPVEPQSTTPKLTVFPR